MQNNRCNKAFTLTELLVVVVVIAVLAGVALPKFNRVLETRRTTEAESLMTAVRTEQEKRCTFNKPYAGTFDRIGDIISRNPSTSSKTTTGSYNYSLEEQGIIASSRGKDYSLKMPSYKDGRLCCEGDYCNSLNKDYPKCDSLSVATDPSCTAPACELDPAGCACNPNQCKCPAYAASHCECSGTCVKECPASSKPAASCNTCGTRSVTCDTATGNWSTGACSVGSAGECAGSECTAGQTKGSQSCNSCGTQTTQKCVNGYWTDGLGACSKTAEQCAAPSKCTHGEAADYVPCNGCGQKYTRYCSYGYWIYGSGPCSKTLAQCGLECEEGSSQTRSCNVCGEQKKTCTGGKWSDYSACDKTSQECGAECEKGETKEEGSCNNCGTQKWMCNSSGKWAMDSCINQGECTPGTTQGYGCFHWGVQTCQRDCTWGAKSCNTEAANQFRKNCNKAGKKHGNYVWDENGCNCMSCSGFVRVIKNGNAFSCADGKTASCVQVWNIF